MSWTTTRLGEAIYVKHGYAFKSKHFSDHGTHIVLTPGNFHEEGGFRRRPDKDRYYAGEIPEDFMLEEGDLIVAMTEQGAGLLGSSALVPSGEFYLHNQRLGLVNITKPDQLDKGFLYYLFNTYEVRGQIAASATGTKVRHTAPKRIGRVEVPLPPVDQQKRIAAILSAYDDLIENNTRRIALLETSARLLYREWFVHLRFPGHEHVRVVDGVPERWEKKGFSELADFVNGYAFKPAHLGDSGLPVVKIPELRDGVSESTPRNPGHSIKKKYHLNSGDLLFSWSGTLLVNIWSGGPALLNQHLFKVDGYDSILKYYLMIALRENIEVFLNHTTGSTMKHIRRSALDNVKALVPSRSLLVEFDSAVRPMYEQVICLQHQTTKLKQARTAPWPSRSTTRTG